jgi:hypothetical protein
MVALLEGAAEQEGEVDHPVDAWRDALMRFIEDYWVKIQSQITCPAKSREPKACYGCVDTQVYACLMKNPQPILHQITLRKKKKEN